MENIEKDDLVIYHYCIGSELTNWFKNIECKKLLIYHNITPSKYFKNYNQSMTEVTFVGRQELSVLVGSVDIIIADSNYNKQELTEIGFSDVSVIPLIIDFKSYNIPPDKKIIEKYKDGKKNILFVGRIAPNKRQEDLILAFEYYKKNINVNSRLILVGANAVPKYFDKIKYLPEKLGLSDVIFSGHVKFDELLAYYSVADVFLCMSEHEGFCVPLLESMYFDIPVIAYGTSAIPDTLGNSGLVFFKKDFARIGELIDIVNTDEIVRKHVINKQRIRLKILITKGIIFKNYQEIIVLVWYNSCCKGEFN